jgi:hypothetical protein
VIAPCLVLVAPDVLPPAGLALPNRPRLFSKNRTDHIKLVFICTLESRYFLALPIPGVAGPPSRLGRLALEEFVRIGCVFVLVGSLTDLTD